ncbi:putative proton-coupled zinc antiporter SLC30A3 isoform 2-T2 [Megaptera novaeangliae]
MEASPATGGSETTRLVSPRDRGGAGGGLRLKSLFTEPSEPLPEEPKPVEMSFHHCHRDPLLQPGLTPERLQAQRQLCAACAVCCVFMAGEVVGGYLAHSLAIMTDAAHLLADVGSMMGSLFSLWLSTRPATRTMTFGWHRSETLGALASVVSLWMVTGILLYLAFIRLLHSDYHIEGGAMLLTASIAVCANLLPGPTTATGPGWQSMHRWRRGLGSPCPWGTPASGRPLCTCWGTSCRALGCWPLPSSSTSSLNTRQLTPSAPFSSPSVPLDPRLPPSEMFSASSWKCQEFGQPTSCTCGPLRLLTMLSPHTWPLTPRLTLKPSWLKPHLGSTPGLDSPALPCRSSSTSLRWPSACAAGSPPKPEAWPHPHPTARPRLSPGLSATASLLTEKGRSWVRTLPLCPLPPADPPAPVGKTKVCVGSGARVRLNREVRAVGVCRSPVVPAPHARGSPQPPVRAVHLSVWQAGWLGDLPVFVLLVCLSLGEVSRGPLPTWLSLCLCRSPKACTLSVCSSLMVLCVCVLVLWPVCLYLCGCAMVSVSLHHPCVCLGVCLAIPLLVLCPRLSQGEGGLRRSSANKLVSNCAVQPLC